MEALFDAVIALGMTLIIMSVEVPKNFDQLLNTFRQLPSFLACFLALLMFWAYHFSFHRRFGLEDFPIIILNAILLFLILSYVYPLKFLTSLLLDPVMGLPSQSGIKTNQIPMLMCFYSGGFAAITGTFALMHYYAYRKRDALELNETERILTKLSVSAHLCHMITGLLSVTIALTFSSRWSALAGLIYFAIGPTQWMNGIYWSRRVPDAEVDEGNDE